MVAVHRGGGGVRWNAQRGKFGIIGLKRANALTVHANPSWHEVGLDGKRVAIALLNARNPAIAFQPRKGLLNHSLLMPRQAKCAQQTSRIERGIFRAAQQLQDSFFHRVLLWWSNGPH